MSDRIQISRQKQKKNVLLIFWNWDFKKAEIKTEDDGHWPKTRSDINLENNELVFKEKRKPLMLRHFRALKRRFDANRRVRFFFSCSILWNSFSKKRGKQKKKYRNAKHFFVLEYSINVLEGFFFSLFFYYSIASVIFPLVLFPMPSRFPCNLSPCSNCC